MLDYPAALVFKFVKNMKTNWEKEFNNYIDKMFKDRFVTDTNLFTWGGKKEFKKAVVDFFKTKINIEKEEKPKITKTITFYACCPTCRRPFKKPKKILVMCKWADCEPKCLCRDCQIERKINEIIKHINSK